MIIVGKRDIRKLSVLPSSQSESNSDYNGKICQHLPLSLNQKPRHLSLPLRLCPPRVIPTRMLRKRSKMLIKGRCFKPMQFKFRLYKMNSNLKGKSSQPVSHAQPVQGSGSQEGPPRSFYALPHDAMVGEYVLSTPHNFSLTTKFTTSLCPSCRNPTLAKCGGEAQHLGKVRSWSPPGLPNV